jgi:hypothetical protein
MRLTRTAITALALAALVAPLASAVRVSAQAYPENVQAYTSWQAAWDQRKYDRDHIVVGEVVEFLPYRLKIARHNGMEQTVDLKKGTAIYPLGATPAQGERAALLGSYSDGTFVVDRVVLRT